MAKFRGAVKTCGECGKEFKVPPSRAATALYCSNDCAKKHRTTGRRDKRVVLICAWCGGRFEEYLSHADRRQYCSDRCRNRDPRDKAARAARITGELNPQWNGGRTMHTDGYVCLSALHHPFASNGYVLEHRLVMENWLREHDPDSKYLIVLGDQKYLSPDFEVHHEDENKANNGIGNLVCMTPAEHRRHHNDKRAGRL